MLFRFGALLPRLPDLRPVAHRHLPAVADDGGVEELGVVKKLFLRRLRGDVGHVQIRVGLAPGVHQLLVGELLADAAVLPGGEPLFEKVNVLTGGGPAGTTSTITQYLYNYGIKSLDFGFGSAGAIVMTLLVLILSSVYIKRAMS